MGNTLQAPGQKALWEAFDINTASDYKVIALAGNPNTGKSTLFNHLTGLNQHTGNWPGKTVVLSKGSFDYQGKRYLLVDLPGTYSLLSKSADEEAARDFLCFANPSATIVVTDATCLERNLNLVLQILEITPQAVICVNLIDEARRKKISVDTGLLASRLGVPVVPISARRKEGITELLEATRAVSHGELINIPLKISYSDEVEKAVAYLEPFLEQMLKGTLDSRWVALRLLEGDKSLLNAIEHFLLPNFNQELGGQLKHAFKLRSV